MNVVLVDDEAFIRLGLEKIMSKMGLDVHVVGSYGNGSEALTGLLSMQEMPVDLLITDIKMPVMDGIKLIERARELFPELSCIVLSGFGEFEYARNAFRQGIKDYLLKPVDKSLLYELLKEIRQRRTAQADDAARGGASGSAEDEGAREHYIVDEMKATLDRSYSSNFELDRLAETVGMSANYISRLFKSKTGLTITDYLIRLRMDKAKQFLTDHPNLKNYEIAQLVGYSDPVYFNKLFKKTVGLTPKDFKEKFR